LTNTAQEHVEKKKIRRAMMVTRDSFCGKPNMYLFILLGIRGINLTKQREEYETVKRMVEKIS